VEAALQHARGGVEQVLDVLVLNLHVTGLDVLLLLPLRDGGEDLVECARHDAAHAAHLVHTPVLECLLALHRERLPAARLPLREHRGRIPVQHRGDQLFRA